MMEQIALSSILGAPVYDEAGSLAGHVREVALSPQDDPARVSDFVVKTSEGDRVLRVQSVRSLDPTSVRSGTVRAVGKAADWPPLVSSGGMLLLERDLLDQQIIDVSGRKVVRVNDIDLRPEAANGSVKLRIGGVDIGLGGARPPPSKSMAPRPAHPALATRTPEKALSPGAAAPVTSSPARAGPFPA